MQEKGSGASSSCRNARQDQAAQPASMRRTQDESDDDHDERLIQVQVCYFSASEANSFPALKAIKIPASEAMCRPVLSTCEWHTGMRQLDAPRHNLGHSPSSTRVTRHRISMPGIEDKCLVSCPGHPGLSFLVHAAVEGAYHPQCATIDFQCATDPSHPWLLHDQARVK